MMPPLQARLTVPELQHTCELEVAVSGGAIETTGRCSEIPVSEAPGTKVTLVLTWYVLSPNLGKEIVLAESLAAVELSQQTVSDEVMPLDFTTFGLKPPRHRADPGEPATEQLRFNCDRTGPFSATESPCDSDKPVPAISTPADTCSNLEEFCRNTLFAAANNTDCP